MQQLGCRGMPGCWNHLTCSPLFRTHSQAAKAARHSPDSIKWLKASDTMAQQVPGTDVLIEDYIENPKTTSWKLGNKEQ